RRALGAAAGDAAALHLARGLVGIERGALLVAAAGAAGAGDDVAHRRVVLALRGVGGRALHAGAGAGLAGGLAGHGGAVLVAGARDAAAGVDVAHRGGAHAGGGVGLRALVAAAVGLAGLVRAIGVVLAGAAG